MGESSIGKQQYAEALIYLQKAQNIYQTQINWEKDPNFAATLNNMSICMIKLQNMQML